MSPTSPALGAHTFSPVMTTCHESKASSHVTSRIPVFPPRFLIQSTFGTFWEGIPMPQTSPGCLLPEPVASVRTAAAASSHYESSRTAISIWWVGIAAPAWTRAVLRCLAIYSALSPSLTRGSFFNSPEHRIWWAVMFRKIYWTSAGIGKPEL